MELCVTHAMPPQQAGAFASLQTLWLLRPLEIAVAWISDELSPGQTSPISAARMVLGLQCPERVLMRLPASLKGGSAKYPHIQAFFHRENHNKSYSSAASVQTAALKHH